MIVLKSEKSEKEDDEAFDLLMRMIELVPEKRIDVMEAIWHPFFDEVREEHFKSHSECKWYQQQVKKRSKKEEK
jgi:serine/threonine protein kinase